MLSHRIYNIKQKGARVATLRGDNKQFPEPLGLDVASLVTFCEGQSAEGER